MTTDIESRRLRLNGLLVVDTHSQGIYPLRAALADGLTMPEAAITVRHVPGAGCYGHNGADDAALDDVTDECNNEGNDEGNNECNEAHGLPAQHNADIIAHMDVDALGTADDMLLEPSSFAAAAPPPVRAPPPPPTARAAGVADDFLTSLFA